MNKLKRFRATFLSQDLLQSETLQSSHDDAAADADDDDYAPPSFLPTDFPSIFGSCQRLLHIKWRLSAGRVPPNKSNQNRGEPKGREASGVAFRAAFGFLRPRLHLFKFNFILAALTCAFITNGMAYKVDLAAPIKAGQNKKKCKPVTSRLRPEDL